MAYTTPPTFGAGTALPASQLNILSDDIEYLYGVAQGVTGSGVQVTRSATTSIPASTSTAITFTAEVYDLGGWWSSGTAITVPSGAVPAGFASIIVHVEAELRFASDATGARAITIYKNGSAVEPGRRVAAVDGGDSTDFGMSRYVSVVAGDTLSLRVYQNSGGALDASSIVFSVMRHAPEA